jgi:type IVB pilus formation R64 PilN family outer membrane protein
MPRFSTVTPAEVLNAAARPAALGLLLLSLAGCAQFDRLKSKVDAGQQRVDALQSELQAFARMRPVIVHERPRLAGESIDLQPAPARPAVLEQRVALVSAGLGLERLLSLLSQETGLAIRLVDTAAALSARQTAGTALRFEGPLHELLDQLARDHGLYWRLDAARGRISLLRFETRHFPLALPAGARTVQAGIAGGSIGSGAAGGGGTGSIGVNLGELQVNPYAAVTRVLASMLLEEGQQVEVLGASGGNASPTPGVGNAASLTPALTAVSSSPGAAGAASSNLHANAREPLQALGGRIIVSPELGTVTVTATPPTLDRIQTYLKDINARLARNVSIDVRIYDLTLSEEAGASFSMDLLYRRMNDVGLSLVGGSNPPLQGGTPGQLLFEVANPSSRFSGSTLLLRALSSFGRVSVATSGQVLALNGQPAPLQVADQITYLASSSVTRSGDLGQLATTTLTPGTVVVGLTANFLPQILDDNRILLQYQLTVSSLRSLNTVSSGTSVIQTPNVFTQSVQQQALLRDGQSVVLFGYEDERASTDGSLGLGNVGRTARGNRTVRVIQLQVFGGGGDV